MFPVHTDAQSEKSCRSSTSLIAGPSIFDASGVRLCSLGQKRLCLTAWNTESYAKKGNKAGLIINMTTGLPFLGLVGNDPWLFGV